MGISLHDLGWGRREFWNNPDGEPCGRLVLSEFRSYQGRLFALARPINGTFNYYFEAEREEDANHRG
jgi:hypothetical protein